jgi:Tfp pilus assembly protein PilV
MSLKNKKRRRGFMLLDVLVSAVIASAVMVGCYSIVATGAGASNAARQNTAAAGVARQVFENIREFKATPLTVGTYSDVTAFGPVPQLALLSGGAASMNVVSYRGTVRQAIVTVTWKAGQTRGLKSRSFTALVVSGGISL